MVFKIKPGLVTQAIGDELLIYDESSNSGHLLSKTAAEVFFACDGIRNLKEISDTVKLNCPTDCTAENKLSLVSHCLDELRDKHLLNPLSDTSRGQTSRRKFLEAAVAALSIPLITTVTVPAPAQAATCMGCQKGTCCQLCNHHNGAGACTTDFCGVEYVKDGATDCGGDTQSVAGTTFCFEQLPLSPLYPYSPDCAAARVWADPGSTYGCCNCGGGHADC